MAVPSLSRAAMSESSIKRLFANETFTLQRLAAICEVAGLEIGDLATLADEQRRNVEQLDESQERALVEDPKLLLMAFMLLNDWQVDEILADYDIDQLEAVRLLARLDRLNEGVA